MFVKFMNASFGLHPHGPHGCSSNSQVYTYIQTQEEACSFGFTSCTKACSLHRGGLPGRKDDGLRTSPHEPALAMEGPDGAPNSSWQKSVASIGISHFVNEIRQD